MAAVATPVGHKGGDVALAALQVVRVAGLDDVPAAGGNPLLAALIQEGTKAIIEGISEMIESEGLLDEDDD